MTELSPRERTRLEKRAEAIEAELENRKPVSVIAAERFFANQAEAAAAIGDEIEEAPEGEERVPTASELAADRILNAPGRTRGNGGWDVWKGTAV